MPARRRRTGSENEPFVVIGGNDSLWSQEKALVNSRYPNNVSGDYYLEDDFVDSYVEPEIVMTARDRTNEFFNTIQSLQGRNIARAVAARDPKKSKAIQSHSEFMLIARNIGKNIASTYAKLEKLTLCELMYSLYIIAFFNNLQMMNDFPLCFLFSSEKEIAL